MVRKEWLAPGPMALAGKTEGTGEMLGEYEPGVPFVHGASGPGTGSALLLHP
jgi:hypothetical protein